MEHLTDFQSTTIGRISYEEKSSTLEVEFHNGGIYQYFDVPPQIWDGFKIAESKGQYIHQYLKGFYRYSKV